MTAAGRSATDARRGALGGLVGVATAIALVGVAIVLFFNPVWVRLEQARSHADAYTGWTLAQTQAVGADVVGEVWLGPGTFQQQVDGTPVFNPREQAHMADVRRVVVGFYALVVLALAALLVTWRVARGSAWWWRAVARGAIGTAIGAVVAGVAFAVFFDAAFTLFHDVFFAAGTWTFNPATDRLVQLFPDAFWTETTIAIAVAGLALTILSWAVARRRANAAAWAGRG